MWNKFLIVILSVARRPGGGAVGGSVSATRPVATVTGHKTTNNQWYLHSHILFHLGYREAFLAVSSSKQLVVPLRETAERYLVTKRANMLIIISVFKCIPIQIAAKPSAGLENSAAKVFIL